MTQSTPRSAADTALEAIQAAIPGPILQHLPIDKIQLVHYDDKKNELPNVMPFRMYFGKIKEGKEKDFEVWILLQKDHSAQRSPDQRFNVFDRFGNIQRRINIGDAVREADATFAFKCLGVIDAEQLRAVIKYYFIFKRVSTPSAWLISKEFLVTLTMACKVAGIYNTRAIAKREKKKGQDSVAQQVHGTRSSIVSNAMRPPLKLRLQRASTASTVALTHKKADLFIPKGSQVSSTSSTNKAQSKTLDKGAIEKVIRNPQSFLLPKAAAPKRAHAATVDNTRGFIYSETEEADNSTPIDNSQSPSARTGSTKVLGETSPSSQSPDDFVFTYRKAINDGDTYKDKIKANNNERRYLREEKQTLKARVADLEEAEQKLEEVERKLKEEHRLTGVTKKRLRESLSGKERALFILGAEIVERKSKRSRAGTELEEGTSGDEF